MADFKKRISTDRFGNPYQIVTLNESFNKKTGESFPGSYKGYAELGGKLYKIETSVRNKETKHGNLAVWCKITGVKKQAQNSTM